MYLRNIDITTFRDLAINKKIVIYGSIPLSYSKMKWDDIKNLLGRIDFVIDNTSREDTKSFVSNSSGSVKLLESFNQLLQIHTLDQVIVIIADDYYIQCFVKEYTNDPLMEDMEFYFLYFLLHNPISKYSLPQPAGVQKIPKIIHYCWFGHNPIPPLFQRCIASWKKYCPDYEIIQWSESNYNINQYEKLASEGRWWHISDTVRLDVVYEHGGIYFDTDAELIKPLDRFLYDECFFGVWAPGNINTGVGFGAGPKNSTIKKMRDGVSNDTRDIDYIPSRENRIHYLSDNTVVYPTDVFCPISYFDVSECFTENTHAIHHHGRSWGKTDDLKTRHRHVIKMREFLTELHGSELYKLNISQWDNI